VVKKFEIMADTKNILAKIQNKIYYAKRLRTMLLPLHRQ
jgi:hypothetical protein